MAEGDVLTTVVHLNESMSPESSTDPFGLAGPRRRTFRLLQPTPSQVDAWGAWSPTRLARCVRWVPFVVTA